MARKLPVINTLNKKVLFVHAVLFLVIGDFLVTKYHSFMPLFILFIIYAVWSYIPLMIVCPSLVKGSVKIIHGTLEGTIPLFEECFNFFQKYPWLDKYRYFFFLNPNDISYREASLDNIANAYVDAGQKQKAIETYEKMIELFPENYIAPFYLKFLK